MYYMSGSMHKRKWIKYVYNLKKNINLFAMVPQEGKCGSKTKQNFNLEAIIVKFYKNNGSLSRMSQCAVDERGWASVYILVTNWMLGEKKRSQRWI